jgi:hypothetical protein
MCQTSKPASARLDVQGMDEGTLSLRWSRTGSLTHKLLSCFQHEPSGNVYILALVVSQVANVVGALYLKQAMQSSTPPHPVTFALYREVMAGAS